MKQIAILLVSMAFTATAYTQLQYSFSSKKIKDNVYEVHITATINDGWTTYSQNTPAGGPAPTVIEFTKNPLITLDGKVQEKGAMKKKYEGVFGVDVYYFEHTVDFVQLVKVKGKAKVTVSGTVQYMVCDKEQCFGPTKVPFSVSLQ